MFRNWGHQWLWERDTIASTLRCVGFSHSNFVEPQQTMSGNPQLENREIRYGGTPLAPTYAWATSVIIEAIK